MEELLGKIAKALVGAVSAVVAAVLAALTDGTLTDPELAAAISAGVLAGLAVWRVPNKTA